MHTIHKTNNTVTNLLLTNAIPYFGFPKVIQTVLGEENKNSDIAQLLNHFNLENVMSSRAHSQSNGMVECR